MPQALDVDYSQAKLIYASTGSYKVAAEQTGISYDAIRQRACREQWPVQVEKAAELVSQSVTRAVGMARLTLQQRSESVREKHAQVAEKAARNGRMRMAPVDLTALWSAAVDSTGRGGGGGGGTYWTGFQQHFLYFFPLLHGHG